MVFKAFSVRNARSAIMLASRFNHWADLHASIIIWVILLSVEISRSLTARFMLFVASTAASLSPSHSMSSHFNMWEMPFCSWSIRGIETIEALSPIRDATTESPPNKWPWIYSGFDWVSDSWHSFRTAGMRRPSFDFLVWSIRRDILPFVSGRLAYLLTIECQHVRIGVIFQAREWKKWSKVS